MPILISDYSPVMNDESEAASVANQAAVAAAVAASVLTGISDIEFPVGTMWVRADGQSGGGLTIDIPEGHSIRFFAPLGSSIKRIAAPLDTAALVNMKANTGVTVEWHGVTLDGNEANCFYDPENRFSEEQSANIRWTTGSGMPEAIKFFRCDVGKNRVGDGYKSSVSMEDCIVSDCITQGDDLRRPRADWQFSRYPNRTTMFTNVICDAWESEPSFTAAGAKLMMTNVRARARFDLGGDSNGDERNPVRVQLTNVRCESDENLSISNTVNFYRVHGEMHNCDFRGIRRIQRCKPKFIGGSITVEDSGDGEADPVSIFHDQVSEAENYSVYGDNRFGNYVVFDGTTFKKDSTVTTGRYIKISTVAKASQQFGPEMVRCALVNCHTPEPLDRVIDASRAGVVEIRGGKLQANEAIVRFGNNGDYYNKLCVTASTLWNSPSLLDIPWDMDVSGSELHVSGEFDGDVMDPLSGSPPRSAPNASWHVNAVMLLDASPDGAKTGFPGLRAKVRTYAEGEPWEYIFDGTDNYGQTTWRASMQG